MYVNLWWYVRAFVKCDLPKISLDYYSITCGQGKVEMVSGAKAFESKILETSNGSNANVKLFNEVFTYSIKSTFILITRKLPLRDYCW